MHFGGTMFFTDYSMSAAELARALDPVGHALGLCGQRGRGEQRRRQCQTKHGTSPCCKLDLPSLT